MGKNLEFKYPTNDDCSLLWVPLSQHCSHLIFPEWQNSLQKFKGKDGEEERIKGCFSPNLYERLRERANDYDVAEN